MAVTLSERAAQHVSNFLAKRGKGVGLKLGVRTTGCSGMAYKLEFADEPPVGDDGIIQDAKFKTYGCGSAIASSSLVTEWVKGKTLDQAMSIRNTHIAEELALPPVKIHCSILAEDAIKAAVADYRKKHGASEGVPAAAALPPRIEAAAELAVAKG